MKKGSCRSKSSLKHSYRVRIQRLEYMGIVRAIKAVHPGALPRRIIGPVMQPALAEVLERKSGCRGERGNAGRWVMPASPLKPTLQTEAVR